MCVFTRNHLTHFQTGVHTRTYVYFDINYTMYVRLILRITKLYMSEKMNNWLKFIDCTILLSSSEVFKCSSVSWNLNSAGVSVFLKWF